MAYHTLQKRLREKTWRRSKNKCWPYLGYINPTGTGMIWGDGRPITIEKAVLLVKLGKIPFGYSALSCPILKDCCNPDHVSLATERDIADRVLWKKRQVRNPEKERRPKTDLSLEIVRQVFLSKEPAKEIAERYGLSRGHVVNIRAGRRYRKFTEALHEDPSIRT